MANNIRPQGSSRDAKPSRKTLRLTFQVANGEVRLVKHERLNMICPPSIGQKPEVGRHGGFWVELRDPQERVLFHRVLDSPLGDSVEVHSPDGKIERVTGIPVAESIFEVLVPDYDEASTVALIGEYLDTAKAMKERAERASEVTKGAREPEGGARELARFEIPQGDKDGDALTRGGAQ
jgi:hypothetical protein